MGSTLKQLLLKQAQALGDPRSLESKGRRAIRLHLKNDVPVQLGRVEKLLASGVKHG